MRNPKTALPRKGLSNPKFIRAAAYSSAIATCALPPDLKVALLKRTNTRGTPKDAIAYATAVRDECVSAGLESLARIFVEQNTSTSAVRTHLEPYQSARLKNKQFSVTASS